MPNPMVKLQVAHLASMTASWRHTYEWLQRCGFSERASFAAIPTKEAQSSLEHLATLNIYVTPFGPPCTKNYPGDKLSFHSPLYGQIRFLQGRLTNVLYDILSHEHWLQLEPGEQSRFLSCRGVGNGLCFRAPSRQSRLHLDDWEFQTRCAICLGHPI